MAHWASNHRILARFCIPAPQNVVKCEQKLHKSRTTLVKREESPEWVPNGAKAASNAVAKCYILRNTLVKHEEISRMGPKWG